MTDELNVKYGQPGAEREGLERLAEELTVDLLGCSDYMSTHDYEIIVGYFHKAAALSGERGQAREAWKLQAAEWLENDVREAQASGWFLNHHQHYLNAAARLGNYIDDCHGEWQANAKIVENST